TETFFFFFYDCKICFNYYDLERHTPKILDCSHTFCQECLETLHSREGRGWRICCPVCRHRTPVPEYRVHNLNDSTAMTEAIRLRKHDPVSTAVNSDEQTGPSASPETPQDRGDSCQTCKHIAFMTGCVCAIFSFLSMVVLLFLGLIFVHNFNNPTSPIGPVCLFVGSVLALFSIIFTWLMCMLKYRPETEGSQVPFVVI
uniref:RING-type domain-containing protein n=1 Tax=Sphaeramia orbicularis TaxID=375764 RepID=A0A673AWA7_9TELE